MQQSWKTTILDPSFSVFFNEEMQPREVKAFRVTQLVREIVLLMSGPGHFHYKIVLYRDAGI